MICISCRNTRSIYTVRSYLTYLDHYATSEVHAGRDCIKGAAERMVARDPAPSCTNGGRILARIENGACLDEAHCILRRVSEARRRS